MKKTLGTLLLIFLFINLFSQEYEIPKKYNFLKDEDYTAYENDVLKTIDWLIQTPLNIKKEKRIEANRFLMTWLEGSPNVTIEIKQEIVTFVSPNADLLMIFMCGWTKYSLENKDYENTKAGNLKGVEAVIDFYLKNKNYLKKDKNVEKYIKLKESGKLEEYISKNG